MIYDDLNKFQQWAIIHMIVAKEEIDKESTYAFYKDLAPKNGEMEIKCTINGVEVDLLTILNRLEECMDAEIEKKANDLIKDKLNDFTHYIDSIKKTMTDHISKKFGIEIEEEDW